MRTCTIGAGLWRPPPTGARAPGGTVYRFSADGRHRRASLGAPRVPHCIVHGKHASTTRAARPGSPVHCFLTLRSWSHLHVGSQRAETTVLIAWPLVPAVAAHAIPHVQHAAPALKVIDLERAAFLRHALRVRFEALFDRLAALAAFARLEALDKVLAQALARGRHDAWLSHRRRRQVSLPGTYTMQGVRPWVADNRLAG